MLLLHCYLLGHIPTPWQLHKAMGSIVMLVLVLFLCWLKISVVYSDGTSSWAALTGKVVVLLFVIIVIFDISMSGS